MWQRPNGRWVVTVTIPNSGGKRLSTSAKSRDMARVKLDELRELSRRKGSELAKADARRRNSPLTIRDVAKAFLKDLETDRTKGEETHKWYLRFLTSFCDYELKPGQQIGSRQFADLRRDHVKKWIAAQTAWKKSNTVRAAGRSVVAMCNWVVKSDADDFELIQQSPLHGFEKAPAEARECDLTGAEWKRLVNSQDGKDFRDTVVFMRLTGCRPGEIRFAEKRHFDPSIPALVFAATEWKCGKRGKVPKDRIIRLPGEALVIVQKRCLKFSTGKLFRGRGDKPFTKDMLARRFKRLSKSLKPPIPHLVPYSLRHTFATDMAFRVDCIVLAELMGTSVKMLESVYAKARKRQDLMGQAAAKAVEGIA